MVLRILSSVCQIGWIGFVIWIAKSEGLGSGEKPVVLALGASAVLTLVALWSAPLSTGDGLIALWIKRKKAEERKKIAEIEGK